MRLPDQTGVIWKQYACNMLYVFCGVDTDTSRGKLHAAVEAFVEQYPNAERISLEAEDVLSGRIDEFVQGQGLFESKVAIVVREALADASVREILSDRIESLAASPNTFFLWERASLDAKTKAAIGKHAAEVVDSSPKRVEKKRWDGNEAFALADALGRRDKKQLWILYTKARLDGKAPEETHGMFFWQVKAMLAAVQSKHPKEAGLSPFPYKKAGAFARNYSIGELRGLSSSLIKMYHQARRGGPPLDLALERWVLAL